MKQAEMFDPRQINGNTAQTDAPGELPSTWISATINLRGNQIWNHQEMLNELHHNNMNRVESNQGQRDTRILTVGGYPPSPEFNQHSILAIVQGYYSEASFVTE